MTEHETVGSAVDDATADALRHAFDVVSFARPVDIVTGAELPDPSTTVGADWSADEVTAGRRRRSIWMVGSAAAAVAAVTAAFVLLPGGSSTAWAATPTPVSTSDQQLATTACAASLGDLGKAPVPGPGSDQAAVPVTSGAGAPNIAVGGSRSVTGSPTSSSTVAGATGITGPISSAGGGTDAPVANGPAPADLPKPPTTLPPLVAVDRRGDRALAVFEDDGSSIACLLSVDGARWTADGMMVGILDKGSGVAVAQMGMASSSASTGGSTTPASNVVAGTVGKDVARVTLTFANGTVAEATVTHGVYAAWFPGDFGSAPPTITEYDAQGHVL